MHREVLRLEPAQLDGVVLVRAALAGFLMGDPVDGVFVTPDLVVEDDAALAGGGRILVSSAEALRARLLAAGPLPRLSLRRPAGAGPALVFAELGVRGPQGETTHAVGFELRDGRIARIVTARCVADLHARFALPATVPDRRVALGPQALRAADRPAPLAVPEPEQADELVAEVLPIAGGGVSVSPPRRRLRRAAG